MRLFFSALLLSLAAACVCPPSFGAYPIGLYGVGDTNDFALVKAAGFNTVAGPASAGYLAAAGAAGLKVLANPGTAAGPRFEAGRAREAIRGFDAHPALWAWYLVDEPDMDMVPPEQVRQAQDFFKSEGARKPTALVLCRGHQSLYYANIADITMQDRYPIPWLPLANFGQHLRLTRLALGPTRQMMAVIQAFDWSYFPELLDAYHRKGLRPPTAVELRAMTYSSLAEGANGLFFYAFDGGGWKMREHPETWRALTNLVAEVQARLPLFEAERVW
ncbi:MAG: hypothetical protein NTW03_00610, partial [Verrucomicrobia bacterium]|nr:hypothetical protein [Verrucomicrobiota bacterium]